MDASNLKIALRKSLRAALPVAALAVGLGLTPAQAQTLDEALAQAYISNPTLESERAQLRATDELVPQARSGYLPQVNAGADVFRQRVEQDQRVQALTPKSVDISVSQPIYRGGRTSASVDQAEAAVKAQRAALVQTEQTVLLNALTAYADVVRDQAVLDLNTNNEQVLRRQLEASQDRFRVGEITRTDVSQSESRLSRANADRILAEGLLNASRAAYARVMGVAPGKLTQPSPQLTLPTSLQETIALAEQNSPAVVAAQYQLEGAEALASAVFGEMLPSVNVTGTMERGWDLAERDTVRNTASIGARLTVPLYQGGGTSARVREAKQTANQRRIQVEEARRQARETAIRAWEALVTSRASIKSRQDQVRSGEIALEGVRQEATVGSRTILDVLDAEQELLDARVQLVRSQRDDLVASFQVLAATGQLTAPRLGLNVPVYDETAHYREVRNKLWGQSID
ncbi:MAG TPA: TolC family outer membrane protein [Azospirillaceae bacterium]|nr:TolC family outer membrane protein [Azospirillaceae bacterium]